MFSRNCQIRSAVARASGWRRIGICSATYDEPLRAIVDRYRCLIRYQHPGRVLV